MEKNNILYYLNIQIKLLDKKMKQLKNENEILKLKIQKKELILKKLEIESNTE